MTPELLVENAPYVSFALVSLILLVPRARVVRFLVALFAALLLAHAAATDQDQVTIIWMSALLGLALLLLTADLLGRRRARLSSEEQAMAARLMPRASRASARHFIDQGFWLQGEAGDVLITEGQPLRNLCYLSAGEARVIMSGQQMGAFGPGDLLGERALFNGGTAPATVVLATRARFWCAPADRLRPYLDVHTHLRTAIERSIAERTDAASAGPSSLGFQSPAVSAA